HIFRSEKVFRSIQVTFEVVALFGKFPIVSKSKYLVAAGIHQDRAVPVDNRMETAGILYDFTTGTKIQVIGVSKDNLRLYFFSKLVLFNRFDGSQCTNSHKNRCGNTAVIGPQSSQPGLG